MRGSYVPPSEDEDEPARTHRLLRRPFRAWARNRGQKLESLTKFWRD